MCVLPCRLYDVPGGDEARVDYLLGTLGIKLVTRALHQESRQMLRALLESQGRSVLRPPPRAVSELPPSQLGAHIKSPAVKMNGFHSGDTTHPPSRTGERFHVTATARDNDDATNDAADHRLPESNGRGASDMYLISSGNGRGSWEGLVQHPDHGVPDSAGFSLHGDRGTAPMQNGKGAVDYGSVDLQALRDMTLEID